MRVTRLEVDLDKFLSNIDLIQKHVDDKEIIPVIKANAYGTYINKRLDILERFKIVAVAIVDEGISIRKLGYTGDILILNQPSYEEVSLIKEYDLTVGLSDSSFMNECLKNNDKFKAHLEIETGMNRTGISLDELEKYMDSILKSNITVEGIYTHFSSADFDDIYTNRQIDIFKKALDIVSSYDVSLKYIHTSASNGLLKYKIPFTNAVRAGIIMYGYESFDGASSIIPVQGICKLKSKIMFLKTVISGEKIGYSQNYTCSENKKIATIPIGYGDGFPRCLSNKGVVYIDGIETNVVGNVCMDSIMVDVSKIDNVKVGDEVYIFYDNKSLEKYASLCNTINYEALCTIQDRVCREFRGGNYE